MNKIYHIKHQTSVVYTYQVYAKSKAEALRKYNNREHYEEVGMDSGAGKDNKIIVSEHGKTHDICSECQTEFSPENVEEFLCHKCQDWQIAVRSL